MRLRLTPAIRELLQETACDASLAEELRAAAGTCAAADSAEWDTIKAAVEAARRRKGADSVPPIDRLCRGSGIAFPERPKQPGKPPELQRRLDELRAKLEQQQYDRMVQDVTQEERKAAALREGGLSTYRQQMSFGVHVLAMMGAFYAFGHVAGMGLTSNKAVHPFVGLVFMVFALVMETVLFIIRTTVPPKLHKEAAARAVAARVAQQQEVQQLGQGQGSAGASGQGARDGMAKRTPAGTSRGGSAGRQPDAAAAAGRKPAGEKKDD